MKTTEKKQKSGFILMMTVIFVSIVALLLSAAIGYTLYVTRTTGSYMRATQCRLAAQTQLESVKRILFTNFQAYYKTDKYGLASELLNCFPETDVPSSIVYFGSTSVTLPTKQRIGDVECSTQIAKTVHRQDSVAMRHAIISLVATAEYKTLVGRKVVKKIEEVVAIGLAQSSVFNYAYFVNNLGWFQGNGGRAHGDIRANGYMNLDSGCVVNGFAYASEDFSKGSGSGTAWSLESYWSNASTRARPTSPTSADGLDWAMGYDAEACKKTSERLLANQEQLEMPYIGDLQTYKYLAQEENGTIKQNNNVLINHVYSGAGPSGIENGADKDSVLLIGTDSNPIVIDGPVVVPGDVLISGVVKGQGTIYAGRNIHILGNIKYQNPPSWKKPDTNPNATAEANRDKDLLGLAAKGNIVIGNYTDRGNWYEDVGYYMSSSFVNPYECDDSDASIGYPKNFNGNYTATDGGSQIVETHTSRYGKEQVTFKTSNDRRYYESSCSDYLINKYARSTITQIDAVLYNNHGIFGKIGDCQFNGALVCRDEGLIYSDRIQFNWDIRLGTSSKDRIKKGIYLPMTPRGPKLLRWREIQ